MESNSQTRELLRKFMLQLRNIDFILVGRIMLELCMKAKNSQGQPLNTLANYNLKKEEIRNNSERVKAYTLCTTEQDKQQEIIRVVMEKLCEGYNLFKAQNDEKNKQEKLKVSLKKEMVRINQAVNLAKQAQKNDSNQLNWREELAKQFEQSYQKNLKTFYLQSGVNKGIVPPEITQKRYQEIMLKLDRGDEEIEEKPYKLDSYLRPLVQLVKQDTLQKPDVDLEKHETKQFRYLFLNQHAYHNYAKYLQDILNDLIKKWEDEYTKWQQQNQDKIDQDAAIRKQYYETDQQNRKIDESTQDKVQQALLNKEAQRIAELQKQNKMNPSEKAEYLRIKKEENDNQLMKRVDDPGNINDKIQEDLENYRNWVIKKKGSQPNLEDVINVINNPNFFLDDHLKYWNKGLKMVAKGRVALVLLAGDSDLKWNYKQDAQEIDNTYTDEKTPFGFRTTGLNSKKCLFQLFCERVEAVQRLAHMYRPDKTLFMENSRVHIYVMTNSENDYRTRKLFRKHLNFGLWKKNIHFFEQGNFPMIGEQGQIRLRDKLRLMNLPDGTGGFYDAVHNNELLKEWDFWGIKYLHVMGIDNLLGRPVDPTLLGMLRGVDGVENGIDIVTKAVEALDVNENLSRIVIQNIDKIQQPSVLRVSELKQANKEIAENCKLAVYNDFACTTEFVKKAIDNRDKWEAFHQTAKNYEFLTQVNGESKKSEDISYIFEKDILDPLVLVQPKMFGVLQVNRRNEYAPVKRLNRSDSIAPQSFDSAIVQMSILHFRWLIDHGYQFINMDFYIKDDLHKMENIEEIQNCLSQRKLETLILRNEDYKQFIGEKSKEEWEKEQEEKRVQKEKKQADQEKARKKKARKLGKSLEEVEVEPISEDEVETEDPKTLYKNLVEIDTRQSLHGENIPLPKSYVQQTANQDTNQESLPFYLKSNARPIKYKLPWMLNEIYRYV